MAFVFGKEPTSPDGKKRGMPDASKVDDEIAETKKRFAAQNVEMEKGHGDRLRALDAASGSYMNRALKEKDDSVVQGLEKLAEAEKHLNDLERPKD